MFLERRREEEEERREMEGRGGEGRHTVV